MLPQTLSYNRYNVSLKDRHIPCCKTLKRSSFKQTQTLPSVKLIFTTLYQFFSLSLLCGQFRLVLIGVLLPHSSSSLSLPTTAQGPKSLGVQGFWIGLYGLLICEILMAHSSRNVNEKCSLSFSIFFFYVDYLKRKAGNVSCFEELFKGHVSSVWNGTLFSPVITLHLIIYWIHLSSRSPSDNSAWCVSQKNSENLFIRIRWAFYVSLIYPYA